MQNTTTVMENLLQTLEVDGFIKNLQEFDRVTQRQCALKALIELRKIDVIRLHGKAPIRAAVHKIRNVLESEASTPPHGPRNSLHHG